MAQENLKLAHRSLDAINRRDLDGFLALMAEDVRVQPQLTEGDDGHAGIRRWWKNAVKGISDLTTEAVEVRDLGDDLTLAVVRARGRGAMSAMPFEQTYFAPARWRKGECVWWGVFLSERDALEAAVPREQRHRS